MFKVNERNTRTRCEIYSKVENMFNFIKKDTLTWCRSGAFIVNFEYISHLVLVFVPFTLSK